MAEMVIPQIPNEKLIGEVIYQDSDIKVICGETEVIIPKADVVCSEASIFRYNNGDILVCTPQNRGKGKGGIYGYINIKGKNIKNNKWGRSR